MTMIERIVKERNEALFSLDREKIEAYMKKYGESDMKDVPEDLFWTSVYKAVCEIKGAPDNVVDTARSWLLAHGMKPYVVG